MKDTLKGHIIQEHKRAEIMQWYFNEHLKTSSPNERGVSESLSHWKNMKKKMGKSVPQEPQTDEGKEDGVGDSLDYLS